jgi:hypothetical protein
MDKNMGFILKLLALSALISVSIKYLGPQVSIDATDINALVIVLLPTVMMAIALFWRFQSAQNQN